MLCVLAQNADYYSQIDLDDLHETDSSQGIALNLPNAQRFMDALGAETSDSGTDRHKSRLDNDAMDIDVSLPSWLVEVWMLTKVK